MVNQKEHEAFDSNRLDQRSFQLGMIYGFAEIVSSGYKRLALSPALTLGEFDIIWTDVKKIANEFGLKLMIDDDFMTTRLFNPEYTIGKRVIHIAVDQKTLDEYQSLKELKRRSIEKQSLTEEIKLELAWGMGKLLSYSDTAIERLLEKPRFQ